MLLQANSSVNIKNFVLAGLCPCWREDPGHCVDPVKRSIGPCVRLNNGRPLGWGVSAWVYIHII